MVKNPGYRFFFLEENPGCLDLRRKIFGRCAPDQNIDRHPNGGGADDVLGGGYRNISCTGVKI